MKPTQIKLLRETSLYRIVESNFGDDTIYFRVWRDGMIQIKLDDGFAHSQGYADLADMIKKNSDMHQYMMQSFGRVPEWIVVPESLNPGVTYTNPADLN